jgi:hypothetical protein
MKLGPCIDLEECTADIFDFGGAVGTWNAIAGTFTVQIEANSFGVFCGGTNNDRQLSFLFLTLNGSGTVSVSVTGTGSNNFTLRNKAIVALDDLVNNVLAEYSSPGGGLTDCGGGPLIEISRTDPFQACACSVLYLYWDTNGASWSGDWTCTFTVTVS